MEITYNSDSFIVFDDVLTSKEFYILRNFIQNQRYKKVNSQEWLKVWRITDGNPLVGELFNYFSEQLLNSIRKDKLNSKNIFPSNTPIDSLFKILIQNINVSEKITGKIDSEWNTISATTYLYPKGTGLSWHSDSISYKGAFIYFAHEVWDSQWGGEFCILNHDLMEGKDNQYKNINEFILDKGIGNFLLPKPNRMIIISTKLHKINKVDDAAGDKMRTSISGFFYKYKDHEKRLANQESPDTYYILNPACIIKEISTEQDTFEVSLMKLTGNKLVKYDLNFLEFQLITRFKSESKIDELVEKLVDDLFTYEDETERNHICLGIQDIISNLIESEILVEYYEFKN